MKQLLLCVTITTAIASYTLAAHSETVTRTVRVVSPQDINQGSGVVIPQNLLQALRDSRSQSAIVIGSKLENLGNIIALNPQPLPPGRYSPRRRS